MYRWIRQAECSHDRSIDLYVKGQEIRIEVKTCESLNDGRWGWQKIFGTSNGKRFDQLILLGRKHEPFLAKYDIPGHKFYDPECPYVIFDVPHDKVSGLTISGGKNARMISLTANPHAEFGRRYRKTGPDPAPANSLYSLYRVTQEELSRRYEAEIPDSP